MTNEKHKNILLNEEQSNELIGAILTAQNCFGDLKSGINDAWDNEQQARIDRLELILKQIIVAPIVDLSEKNGSSANDLDNYTFDSINSRRMHSSNIPRVQLKHRTLPEGK